MTERRRRMDHDRLVRGMAERTREACIAAGARVARPDRRSPDQRSPGRSQRLSSP
ncbi:MAG: hypothetical protein HYV08_15140 [Deltaproteobacteria bacterium]|nr:hypothetical protein [Deltaproteobacteria bacterium]